MKKFAFNLFLLALMVFAFSAVDTFAQKPLKGAWTFMIQTPMGTLPVPVTFKAAGKGTLVVPTGTLPLAYREKAAGVSLAFEGAGLAPDGTDLSFVVRGTKTDTAFTGTAIAITSTADPSNPTGFAVLQLPTTGKRN